VSDSATLTPSKCDECKGRGWHHGDCHPAEICGICNGFGTIDAARHPDDVFDGRAIRRLGAEP
jgi:DnaJ-class molecular chaperone